MSQRVIECTVCDNSFCSEEEFSSHECITEQKVDLLNIKEEPFDDFEIPEVDCQLTEIKEEKLDIDDTAVDELDPLALCGDEELVDNPSESVDDPTFPITPSWKEAAGKSSSILIKTLNKYHCKICGGAFVKKDDFNKHFKTEHKSYRPYECQVCKKKFLHKHYVTLHMRVHTGEKPYECKLCPKAYSHKTSYTIHMRIHSGERPYGCSVCGKRCYDKSGLTSHMRSHTKETPYQCEVCGRRFTHSKSLLVHRRNHTGEKPYVCSYCGKAFRHWHKHKIHVRLHTGERPYKCKICNKGFPRNDEVSRHMKSHTGIKSFKCSICGVYCATQASITGHINLHHQSLKEENEEPPEKTLVENSKSGILGSKVPEQRSMYRKIYTLGKKSNTQPAATNTPPSEDFKKGAETSMKSPTRVIEITSKDVPLPLPIKSKKLKRAMPMTTSKDSSTSADTDTEPLNTVAFMEWQQRMLTNQGLVVKGFSDSQTLVAPKVSQPTILKASSSLGENSPSSDQSKPQYILISQGTGPNATKLLLPLSMAGSLMSQQSVGSANNNKQQMFLMSNNNSQRMFLVSPQKQNNAGIKFQISGKQIKEEPIDDPLLSTIKTEDPDADMASLLDDLQVEIKSEPV